MNPQQLITAAAIDDRETVRHMLLTGCDVDVRDSDGETALNWAAFMGHTAVVKDLLTAGADRAVVGRRLGLPPLALALLRGQRGAVALLLPTADLDVQVGEPRRPLLHLALAPNEAKRADRRQRIVELLLGAGARPDLADDDGVTPLMIAAGLGAEELVALLLEAGADPQRRDSAGRSAADHAAAAGRQVAALQG